MKFAEFNKEINPSETACYRIESSMGNIKNTTYRDSVAMLKNSLDARIYMTIPKGCMVIETKCKAVVDLIKARNEKLIVVKNDTTYQIYGKSTFDKNTKNNVLSCGCNADTLVNTKGGTEILLPFHAPANPTPVFQKMSIEHETTTLGTFPKWLTPIKKASSPFESGLELPIVNNTIKLLFNHIANLSGFTKDEQIEMLEFMNDNLVSPKLTQDILNKIIEGLSESLLQQFMNKNEFYHDKFGDYVINACNIKKDKISKDLYFYDTKNNIYTSDQDYLRGYITKLCPRLKKYQKDEAIEYIKDSLEYDAVEFNTNEFNIVFKNGILHLEDMTFESMSPDQLESVQIDAEWDPTAHSDTVDEFFKTATCNDPQAETLLYEAIGYAMLKTNQLAKMFMLIGNGRNGKSTYLDLIKAVLGKRNCTSLAPKDLESSFRPSMLLGKLASLAGDISAAPIKENDILKQITSGDDITFERKYRDAVTGSVYATLFFACNKLPRSNDNSYGNFRRWTIIPFNADLTKVSNVDGFAFKKKLVSQESINYVAYKAAHAIYKVFETTKEFTNPKAAQDALEQYKIDCSSVLSWLKDSLLNNMKLLQEQIDRGLAYGRYQDWCKDNNRTPFSITQFKNELKASVPGVKI